MKSIILSVTIFIISLVMIFPAASQQQQQQQQPQKQQEVRKQQTQTQTTVQTSGVKIKWYDLPQALDQQKKKPKKIFIDMYTDWCGWCKKMDASTFVNPVIVDYMNQNFYAVKFNAERKDTMQFKGKSYVNLNPAASRSSHQLAQQLLMGRMSFPSFVFLDEAQGTITIVPGYQKAPQFEAILHFIGEDAYKTQKWDEFMPTFKGTATE